jgi:membrane protease subunit (stomatin/prohibitin family)
MGFVNKLRGELVDIVELVDDSRNTLVRRFPRYHNQIKNGARLVVRPGQSAVFVDRGKVADVFGPGTYELTTPNLPLLSTLQGWKHGFESPFKAEVYFVTTRQVTELKWGTPNPVLLRDPELGPLRVRAFGTYTLRALKPEALLSELVGTDGAFEADEIEVLLRSIIATEFSEMVAKSEISVVDLAGNYGRLSETLRRAVLAKVDDEYGLDIPQLWIVNVSVPEQVEQAVDARSSMGVIGDLGRYQQYQLSGCGGRGPGHGHGVRRRGRRRRRPAGRDRGGRDEGSPSAGPAHSRGRPRRVVRGLGGPHSRSFHDGAAGSGGHGGTAHGGDPHVDRGPLRLDADGSGAAPLGPVRPPASTHAVAGDGASGGPGPQSCIRVMGRGPGVGTGLLSSRVSDWREAAYATFARGRRRRSRAARRATRSGGCSMRVAAFEVPLRGAP